MPTPTRIAVVGVPPLLHPWLLDLLHSLPATVDADFTAHAPTPLGSGPAEPGDVPDGLLWCPVDVPPAALDAQLARLRRVGLPLLVVDLFGSSEVAETARREGASLVRFGAGRAALAAAIDDLLRVASGLGPAADRAGAPTVAAPDLSEREEHVLRLYAAGVLIKQIAFELGLSLNTVKSYRARIQAKYAAAGVELRQRLDFHIEARRRYPDFDASDVFTRSRRLRSVAVVGTELSEPSVAGSTPAEAAPGSLGAVPGGRGRTATLVPVD